MKKKQGQSLTEYSLAIGLVAITGIASLSLLGGNISDLLMNAMMGKSTVLANSTPNQNNILVSVPENRQVLDNLSAPAVSALETQPTVQNNPSLNRSALSDQTVIASARSAPFPSQRICITRICANFPVVDASNDKIDVVGGNGTERIYQFVQTLEELAKSIEEDPQGDPKLAKLIRETATSGHNLGKEQKNGSQCDFYCDNRWIKRYKSTVDGFEESKKTLSLFLTSHPESVNDQVRDILNLQSNQIIVLSKLYKTEEVVYKQPRTSPGGSQSTLLNPNPPKLIHQSANTICDQQRRYACKVQE
jgi:hypothetical protein